MVELATSRERRDRVRGPRTPRHRAVGAPVDFSSSFAALGELAYDGAQVSASIVDIDSRAALVGIDERVALPTASVGKILLLIEIAARMSDSGAAELAILDRSPLDAVGDSGVWQHLQAPALPLADLATLIGAVSDNLATNVLLREVGLEAIQARTAELGLTRTALLDRVREVRGPDDAPQLSVGSAVELTTLFTALAHGEAVDRVASDRVLAWLSLNADLSMVASAFGLDPLAHRDSDHGLRLANKTGTDVGIRSETGLLRGPKRSVAYAVTVQFTDSGMAARLRVIEAMRTVGVDLLEYVH